MLSTINIGNLKEKNSSQQGENNLINNNPKFNTNSEKEIERLIRMYECSSQWESQGIRVT